MLVTIIDLNSRELSNYFHSLRPISSQHPLIKMRAPFIEYVHNFMPLHSIQYNIHIFIDLQFVKALLVKLNVFGQLSKRMSFLAHRRGCPTHSEGAPGIDCETSSDPRLATRQINAKRDNEPCHRTRSPGWLFISDIRYNCHTSQVAVGIRGSNWKWRFYGFVWLVFSDIKRLSDKSGFSFPTQVVCAESAIDWTRLNDSPEQITTITIILLLRSKYHWNVSFESFLGHEQCECSWFIINFKHVFPRLKGSGIA